MATTCPDFFGKQSLSYKVTLHLEFASARNHLLKIKFLLPRNDAAVWVCTGGDCFAVSFVEVSLIEVGVFVVIHFAVICEKPGKFLFF
jgi:hypothetical protein